MLWDKCAPFTIACDPMVLHIYIYKETESERESSCTLSSTSALNGGGGGVGERISSLFTCVVIYYWHHCLN